MGSELPFGWNSGVVLSGGLTNGRPPAGEQVVWQAWCYSEDSLQEHGIGGPYRWLLVAEGETEEVAAPSVEDIAQLLYEQIEGRMPDPEVVTSPPAGTDAIVSVPVFVSVANWPDGGELVESQDLLGVSVTVRATPELVLDPAEPGGSAMTCSGPGVGYDPDGGDLWAQAESSAACTHSYGLRTGVEDRPGQWPSTATVRWSISWSAATGEGGSFPVVEQSVAIPRGVSEVQTVVTSGDR